MKKFKDEKNVNESVIEGEVVNESSEGEVVNESSEEKVTVKNKVKDFVHNHKKGCLAAGASVLGIVGAIVYAATRKSDDIIDGEYDESEMTTPELSDGFVKELETTEFVEEQSE